MNNNLVIIDNDDDLRDLLLRWNIEDSIFDIIPLDNNTHPINSIISLIIIRFSDIDCIIPLNHNEMVGIDISKDTLINIISQSNSIKYVFNKKAIIEILPRYDIDKVYDINIERFINGEELIYGEDFDTNAHKFFNSKFHNVSNINKKIPILKHYEKFCDMCEGVDFKISDEFKFKKWNNDFINSLVTIEKNGLKINDELFISKFGDKVKRLINDGVVYSQYNIYTSTSRPSNKFGGINFAALNKEDGSRNCFVSRYGNDGGIFMIDYSAYHPRLIAQLVEYDLPIDIDAYEYFGKLFLNKEVLNKEEIDETKKIVFRLLYGGIDVEFRTIPYFKKMSDYIDLIWDISNERGYAETPLFKRKVYLKDIEDVNKNKLFNYTCQAAETEFNCGILKTLCSHLIDKEIKLILYMYDSFIFDIHKSEVGNIKNLVEIVKDNNKFPVKCYFGKSLGSVKRVKL